MKNSCLVTLTLVAGLSLIITLSSPASIFAQEQNRLENKAVASKGSAENFIEIASSQGMVQIKKAGAAQWSEAATGTKLYSNDQIRTLIDSFTQLKYPDQTTLTLRENSILTIQDFSVDSKTGLVKRELKLNLGGMKYKVTRLEEKGSEFKIHSSTAIVGITGTEGTITNEGEDKPTKNILTEGTTYNTDESGQNGRPLKAGNAWEIDKDARADRHTLTDEERRDQEYRERNAQEQARFNSFLKKFNQKKEQGYDVKPLSELLDKLYRASAENDLTAMKTLFDQAEKEIEKLNKLQDPAALETNEIIQQLLKEIEQKKTDGFDLSQVYPLISKALNHCQNGEYAGAKEVIEDIQHLLTVLEKKPDDFIQRLNQFLEELNTKAKAGFIVQEITEIASRLKIAADNQDRPQAEELLLKAKQMLAMAKRDISEELLKALETLKTEISAQKKAGFDTTRLEELLALADKAKEAKEYLKLEELVSQIREKLTQGLIKTLSPEILALFNNFEEAVTKKRADGYDLTPLQDLINSVYQAKESADSAQLAKLLTQIREALAKLGAPEKILRRLEDIRNRVAEKQKAGYEIKALLDLINQIQSTLDKGAITDAHNLLIKAEELLNSLKDTQPPTLQAGDLIYQDKEVVVSGFATDNTRVAWVNVNGAQASLLEDGRFEKKLLLTAELKEILIEAADSDGNLAPEIHIPIPTDKLIPAQTEDKTPPELKPEGINLDYLLPDQLKINGKTEAGALLIINQKEVTADGEGGFSLQLIADKELIDSGLNISARDANGNSSDSINIKVEDKWPARIIINSIELYDNLPPALKVNDLIYEKDKIKINGTCVDAANVLLKGSIKDVGLGIKEITLNGQKLILEGEAFKSALPLTADLKSADFTVEDLAGNKTTLSRPIGFFPAPALVNVNNNRASVDKDGNFLTSLNLDAELHQVIVLAKDALGNEASPVKLLVADRVAPKITLGDVLYTLDTVQIDGMTKPQALISDKSQKLFSEKISADSNGIFQIKAKRPAQDTVIQLSAEDLSGNISEDLTLNILALVDQKPPMLTVANLDYKGNKVRVSGSAEDDSGIQSVTINGRLAVLDNGRFSEELDITAGLIKVEVVATDLSGKITSVTRVVEDNAKPLIELKELNYEEGYVVIQGNATDNIGLKEVRINNIPISLKLPEGGEFEHKLAVNADLKEVTATAVDLYGNYSETAPKAIVLPPDNTLPILTLNDLSYGSPIAIVSGTAKDNLGIQNVLVNNIPVNVYEDGTFKTQLPITFNPPVITLDSPEYETNLVVISGKVDLGAQDPREINAQAQDLSGNKSAILKKTVEPFKLNDLRVTVNGKLVNLDGNSFSAKIALEKNMPDIEAKAIDPFDNTSGAMRIPLEKTPPVLNVNPPAYQDNNVNISGSATDSGSGISEILINNKSISFGNDGKFSQALNINEQNIIVVAIDKLGNMATAPPIKLEPPDKAPPVFLIKVSPTPATVGKNVFINIDSLDSKTRLPEILPNPVELTLALPNGENRKLNVSGAGASFNAALETTGLPTGMININAKGADQAGNSSDKIEGINSFLLNSADSIPPTFKIDTLPAGVVSPGTNLKVIITSSETLKSLPKADIALPGGINFPLNLEGPLSGTLFSANLALPQNLAPGEAKINLKEAMDLSGNIQSAPIEFIFSVRPEITRAGLPLYIESSQISPDKISIRGNTAAAAILHLTLADIKADLPADENGRFSFIREITQVDIEKWLKNFGPFLRLEAYATNYAGSSSDRIILNIPLPALTTGVPKDSELVIEINPEALEQGKQANIKVKSRRDLNQPPRGMVRLNDGRVEMLTLSGSGKEFSGTYQASATQRPGPAMIEVRAGELFQTRAFIILPSLVDRANSFIINVNPDPIIIGKESNITVTSQRALDNAPRLGIKLPNGKPENIPLSGAGTEFKGKYLCPTNTPPGPAELIINDGEFRRQCAITPELTLPKNPNNDLIININPMPMLAGASATITLRSKEDLDALLKIDLRLNNGQVIPITLAGRVPGNTFNGQINIPADAPIGMAAILVKSNTGDFLKEFPTGIAPPRYNPKGKFEAFIMPTPSMPGQNVVINVNSKEGPINYLPQARLRFSDGIASDPPIRLEGPLPGQYFRGFTTIPNTAAYGNVSIDVIYNTEIVSNAGQGMIGSRQPSGELQINTIPPQIIPGSTFEVSIFSPDTIIKLHKATLDIPGKPIIDIKLTGHVPGNSFRATLTFPRDAKVLESKIIVDYETVYEKKSATKPLEGKDGNGPGELELRLNPDPPIIGRALVITLSSRGALDFIPAARVNYANGQNPDLVPLFGSPGGNTFSGTLTIVANVIESIDIINSDNKEFKKKFIPRPPDAGGPPVPTFDPPSPLMPPVIVNTMLDFPKSQTILPTANLLIPASGENITISMSGPLPGNHFSGIFNLPAGTPKGQAYIQVKSGRPVIDTFTIDIGSNDPAPINSLNLRVYPSANSGELVLDWDLYPNAVSHKITFTPIAPNITQPITVGRLNHYVLTNLMPDTNYQVTIKAFNATNATKEFAISENVPGTPRRDDRPPTIYINPNPPIVGQPVDIRITFLSSIQLIPIVKAQYQTMGEDPVPITETTPGLVFSGRLNLVKEAITYINLYDPRDNKKYPFPVNQNPIPNITCPDLSSITLNVSPASPVIGQSVTFAVDIPLNQPKLITRPTLKINYASGTSQNITLPIGDLTAGRHFEGTLPSLLYEISSIDVDLADCGMRNFPRNPAGGSNLKALITVTPDPPVTGNYTPVKINIVDKNTNQPINITTHPQVYAKFLNNQTPLNVTGALPGSTFNADITATIFTSALEYIYVAYNGAEIGRKNFTQTPTSPNTLTVTPDPPIVGQNLTVSFQAGTPQALQPYARFTFGDGTQSDILMSGAAASTSFSYNYPSLPKSIQKIEILDNGKNKYTPTPVEKSFTVSGTSNIYFIRVYYSTGTPQDYQITVTTPDIRPSSWQLAASPDNPGMAAFSAIATNTFAGTSNNTAIPASTYTPTKMELRDNTKTILLATNNFGTSCPDPNSVTLEVRPSPPILGQPVTFVVDIPMGQPSLTTRPTIKVNYTSGTNEIVTLPIGDLTAGRHFEGTLTSLAYIFDSVDINLGAPCDPIHKTPTPPTDCPWVLTVSPDPPILNQTCTLTLTNTCGKTLSQAPQAKVYFTDNTNRPYFFTGSGSTYTYTIGAGDILYYINKIELFHGDGTPFPDLNPPSPFIFNTPCEMGPPTNPRSESTGVPTERIIRWDPVSGASGYTIFYGTSKENANQFNKITSNPGGDVITGLTVGQTYWFYVTVNGCPSSQHLEPISFTAGSCVSGLTATNAGTGGTINLSWNSACANIHYHIYYRTASGAYSSTPYTNTSSMSAQVTGLTNSTLYYFAVKGSPGTAHIANDTEDSNTNEISATPTAAPAVTGLTASDAGTGGTVNLSWNSVGAGYHYHVYHSASNPITDFSSPTPVSNSTTVQITGLANNTTRYFIVRSIPGASHVANDTGTDTNTTQVSATPTSPSSVNHIVLATVPSGTSTSVVGKPVLIKATAFSSSDDSAVATAFSSSVTVNASSTGNQHILSLQNRVSGAISGLQLNSGIGYFTVDAVQAEAVTLNISSHTSNTLNLNFSTPTSPDLSASQIALTYDSDSIVNTPAKVTIFVVNNYGKTAVNYTGTINIGLAGGATANLTTVPSEAGGVITGSSPSYIYTFVAGDYGKASFNLNNTASGTVNFNVSAGGGISSSGSVLFAGVEKFLIEPTNPVIRGSSIQLKAYATTANGKKVTAYNSSPGSDPAVTWVRDSETGGSTSNSSSITPANPLSFANGEAIFTLSDSELEQVAFHITNGTKVSNNVSAWFRSSTDTTSPDISSAVAETPFLIHLYFTEEIDSVNALRKDNYSGVGNINKVCWYGDDVTLHLAAPLALSSSQSVTVKGLIPNGIRDVNGNYLKYDQSGNYLGDKVAGFTVPNVNYQGSSYGSGDWLEINVSPSTVSYITNSTIRVIVYHKNACGYLTGSNAANKTTNVTGVNITYNTTPSGAPTTATMSDGKCEFNVTPNFTSPGQTLTITATANGVTSGTATITSN